MANPSKRIGTAWENQCLENLRDIFGQGVDRAKTNSPSNDFHGAPIPLEAKCRKTWAIPDWIRKIRRVSHDDRWAILISPRDMRKEGSKELGQIMVLPLEFGYELLDAYYNPEDSLSPEDLSRVDL